MIVNNPDLVSGNPKEVQAFYKNLLLPMGIKGNDVSVFPWHGNGDFDVTDVAPDSYFDICNPSVGPIAAAGIAAYKGRSFLHGNLFTTNYVQAMTGVGPLIYNNFLSSGPVSGLTHWLYKSRNGVTQGDSTVPGYGGVNFPGIAANVNGSNYLDQFNSILFNFLRMNSSTGAGTYTVRIEYLFVGLRIDF